MRFRERNDELEQERRDPPGAAPGLDALRAAGTELLAAGDAAINRVLSGNSERFLASNRQQGGQ